MRTLLVSSFAFTACSSQVSEPITPAPDVRTRLAAPTRMLVSQGTSSGSVTAKRQTQDGWQGGPVVLQLADGDFNATVNADGQLALADLRLDFAPIDVPDSVFNKPAQLQNVRLAFANAPAATAAKWSDADYATATPTIALDLSWSIAIAGSAMPLGTQHLPAMPVDVTVSGDGAHVAATLG